MFGAVNVGLTTAIGVFARVKLVITTDGDAKHMEIEGVIQHVDVVIRDVTVFARGRATSFDVPPDCTILLNGEKVKLRLLQPHDHVRVTYTHENAVPIAKRIEAGTSREHYAEARNPQEGFK
ncbi:MAG TPA: hypothetical protein VKU82_12110 [Planctomycetaceae bacterium]|nr:hypothetical protein [Planctomycetaceae bacterium]